jgi:hypothetical protein
MAAAIGMCRHTRFLTTDLLYESPSNRSIGPTGCLENRTGVYKRQDAERDKLLKIRMKIEHDEAQYVSILK